MAARTARRFQQEPYEPRVSDKPAAQDHSPTNGIDHLAARTTSRSAQQPQRRDRTVSGMSASFHTNSRARLRKLENAFKRMKTLADRTRYRYTDRQIDFMQQKAQAWLDDMIGAFRTGRGTESQFEWPDDL